MKSFPFDSAVTYDSLGNPEYDRAADSALLADFLHLMFTDGVFPNPSTGLQVVASENEMSVVVCPGNTMIQGRMGIEEVARTLVFEASGTSYDRIDAVVARLNTNYAYRDIDLYVVKGTASATPAAPELTRTGGIYELRLANVFIAKNTTMISAERITDTRLNTEDCGIVTSNPQRVDTTAIFNQYQAALEKYLRFVRDCIDGTTAGSILARLDGVDTRLGAADISAIGDGSVTGAIAAQGTAINALNTDMSNYKLTYANGERIAEIEMPKSGYYLIGNPVAPIKPVFATVYTWHTNTGAFSVAGPSGESGFLVIGNPGTIITGLVVRYWYYDN